MPQIEAGKVRPFVLALYGPIEWDADYSPWYATALQGREFAGNAPQYLDFIQYRLLPYLKESFPLSGEVYTLGYSLGGLAALYYYFELGFAGCISCSGSLWYPGFQDYCREQIEKKLQEKGATEAEARYAGEWLEAIGAIDDAAYAAMLVRHYSAQGCGPARIRDELYRRGVPRELWDEALETAPDAQETLACVIASKTRGKPLNEKDYKRLSDALLRRGFSWGEVKTALRAAGAALTDADDGL